MERIFGAILIGIKQRLLSKNKCRCGGDLFKKFCALKLLQYLNKKVLKNENIQTKFHAIFNNDRFLKKNENLFNATSTIYKHYIKKNMLWHVY